MSGMAAHGFSYGGVQPLIVPFHIPGGHERECAHPVVRETHVRHHHVGQLPQQAAHFGGARSGVVHVYLQQSAVPDEVLYRMSAAAHAGGYDAGHPVLYGLRFGFMSRQGCEAHILLYACLEHIAAHIVYILSKADDP